MALAIGDIHGCDTALKTLLDGIQPSSEQHIITLGDYVDRGPDSKAVISELLKLKESHQYTHLMGNHEIQMIRALEAPHHMTRFLSAACGGQETLDNYGGRFEDIPEDHWNFITSAELYYESDTHIFVHAGLDPQLSMADQDPEVLYYQRFYEAKPHISGKPYLCGHTIQGDEPTDLGFAICLDTCAYGGGWITAFDTESKVFYQANERGKFQELAL